MRPSSKNIGPPIRAGIVGLAWLAGSTASAPAAETAGGTTTNLPKQGMGRFLNDLLPTPWQKRPLLHYNVITEMTPEGRKRRTPTPSAPMTYFCTPGKFVQTGWMVAAGEKPPPAADLEAALRQALAANGYLAVENDREHPEILIILTFGSSGTDPLALAEDGETDGSPNTAEELVTFVVRDPALFRDVVERARFVAGDRFAIELKAALQQEVGNLRVNQSAQRLPGGPGVRGITLPVSPDAGSPFQLFLNSGDGNTTRQLVELAFHTCYFVVATAYDFSGVEHRQKIPLWQTRMAVEAQGVAMTEVLQPLIVSAGSFLGRETTEAVVIDKRLNREGRVEIGTPTVVPEAKPGTADGKSNPR